MYREAVLELEEWVECQDKKPLILWGTKGVGKNWIARDFGNAFFSDSLYINLNKEEQVRKILNGTLDKKQISRMLKKIHGKAFDSEKTLIIIDNIHLIPEIIKLCDFFYQEMKEYRFCGITHQNPEMIFQDFENSAYLKKILPMSFKEFLIAQKRNDLCKIIEEHNELQVKEQERKEILEHLETYYITGGMPRVVRRWFDTKDFILVKNSKENIVKRWREDFLQIKNKAFQKKVIEIWESIPRQLEREVKKFHYDLVRLTARKREYEDALNWLVKNNYLFILPHMERKDFFEIFYPDVGILALGMGVDSLDDCQEEMIFRLKNNGLTEQYVLQQVLGSKTINHICYWNSKATARIEFVFEDSGAKIPVFINVVGNNKLQSLRVFKERYKNPVAVKVTFDSFLAEKGYLNIPIYGIWNI